MIYFDGQKFESIRRFDCHVVDLVRVGGGGFFTVIPISSAAYRKSNPTHASVSVTPKKRQTIFCISDDFGCLHIMRIGNEHKVEIERAIMSAEEQGLLI